MARILLCYWLVAYIERCRQDWTDWIFSRNLMSFAKKMLYFMILLTELLKWQKENQCICRQKSCQKSTVCYKKIDKWPLSTNFSQQTLSAQISTHRSLSCSVSRGRGLNQSMLDSHRFCQRPGGWQQALHAQQCRATRRPPARFSTVPSFSLGPRPAMNDKWLTSRNFSWIHT